MEDYKNLPSGILGKKQIDHAISNYNLIENSDSNSLQPCSYDLRVGTIYKEGKMIEQNRIPVDMEPGEMITVHTLESLNLPNDIAATVFPINGQSSEGLMVLNPGHIDPGYKGMVTVKAINLRKNPLSIMREEIIFTIIFEKLPLETESYGKNVSNDIKKRKQLKKERDVSPENLFNIPKHLKKNKVFAYTESDVYKIVATQGLARATLVLALLAVLISVSTFIFSTRSFLKDGETQLSTDNNAKAANETQYLPPNKQAIGQEIKIGSTVSDNKVDEGVENQSLKEVSSKEGNSLKESFANESNDSDI